MKSRRLTCTTAIALFAALAIPVRLRVAAQEQPTTQQAGSTQAERAQHTRYEFIDIPTLGGPAAFGEVDNPGFAQFINNSGIVVGGADTSIPDPNAPNCNNPTCFLNHGFRWQDGVLTDLGALPGVNWSHATSINARGWATGGSSTEVIDPLIGAPAEHAVLWKDGEIIDLGTLGTGFESAGLYVNNAGEVVGFSTFDTTPVPSFLGAASHAFIWKNGVMRDLGTLGGPGSFPAGGCNNERAGLVAGNSSTSSTAPTHAFLWDNGTMTDIPTLGGTFAVAQCANNRGKVIGQSNLAGDVEQHAFSWEHGTLTDLGTLGGTFSIAIWLNNEGKAVGGATTTDDQSFHGTLWSNGVITDLGTLDGDCFSVANAINSHGAIIGQSFSCDGTISRAVLWDKGSIIDLQAAIPPSSTLQLTETFNINERGEIVGRGLPAGCDNLDACGHVFLLIPCDQNGAQGCENNAGSNPATRSMTTTTTQDPQKTKEFIARWRARLAQRYHFPGTVTRPAD
jgi:probable HAF family extracellular repeat protein